MKLTKGEPGPSQHATRAETTTSRTGGDLNANQGAKKNVVSRDFQNDEGKCC